MAAANSQLLPMTGNDESMRPAGSHATGMASDPLIREQLVRNFAEPRLRLIDEIEAFPAICC